VRDAEQKKLIGTIVNGKEYTKDDYIQWRLAQVGRGERMAALRDKLAARYTQAYETAVAYINDATPGIYSINRNYASYTIEKVAGDVDFTLWNEQTVKKLIVSQPYLMPYYPKSKVAKHLKTMEYEKKLVTKAVTQGLLQGESIEKIAKRIIKDIPEMSWRTAVKTARTNVTTAQNAGRQDAYKAAENMGIEMQRVWMCTLDGKTREAHQLADGQTVGVDEPFLVGGEQLMFPGDPDGSPWNIENCRCTQVARVKGTKIDGMKRGYRDEEGQWKVTEKYQTYREWEAAKRER
jgi:hypothetical protein